MKENTSHSEAHKPKKTQPSNEWQAYVPACDRYTIIRNIFTLTVSESDARCTNNSDFGQYATVSDRFSSNKQKTNEMRLVYETRNAMGSDGPNLFIAIN